MIEFLQRFFLGYDFSCIMCKFFNEGLVAVQIIVETVTIISCLFKTEKTPLNRFVMFIFSVALVISITCTITDVYHCEESLEGYDTYIYFGKTKGNKASGKGRLFDSENKLVYIGEFKNNLKDGEGKEYYIDENGDSILKYKGEYKKGLKSGKGVLYFLSGSLLGDEEYNGDYYDDVFNGSGILCFCDGKEYMGNFLNGSVYGFGIMKWKIGEDEDTEHNCLVGNFSTGEQGEIKTIGRFYINDRLKYDGEFINYIPNGIARYYEDGENIKYEGNFLNGSYYGYGTIYYDEKDEFGNPLVNYAGEFVNGLKEGQGVLYDEHQNIIAQGFFSNNNYIGDSN